MSLNGLDATEVSEAYLSALGEGGGWFLLQYTSRAEVGLLKKGSGGVHEVKETVAHYVEQSPLYGFVQYRRRKVLLKYVPEGTSRLLQARLAVHFQSISEKFAPHDTIFSFTAAAELMDNALSAACSLHTAPASIKSSTSLRQKGLAGITEDASENQTTMALSSSTGQEAAEFSGENDGNTRLDEKPKSKSPPPVRKNSSPVPSSRTICITDKALPPTPDSRYEEERPKRDIDSGDSQVRSSFEGRQSSQSTRPSTREGYSAYEYKPKVKLGPRPSLDSYTGLPTSDPASRAYDPRPVSTLPVSVRMPTRKAVSSRPIPPRRQTPPVAPRSPVSKPAAAPSISSGSSSISSTPTVVPERPIPKPISTALLRSSATETKAPYMTPEKRRLMKALELRQKQSAAQKRAQGLRLDGVSTHTPSVKATKPIQDQGATGSSVEVSEAFGTHDTLQTVMPDDDSGIVHLGTADLMRSNCANADTSPISIPEASDGPSTQASSICEEDSCLVGKSANDRIRSQEVANNAAASGNATSGGDDVKMTFPKDQPMVDIALEKSSSETKAQNEPMRDRGEVAGAQEAAFADECFQLKSTDDKEDLSSSESQEFPVADNVTDIFEAPLPPSEEQEVQLPSIALAQADLGNNSQRRESQESLSKPLSLEADTVCPHEVPLPAISEDEEMLLSPQGKFRTCSQIAQPISPTELRAQPISQTTCHPKEHDGRSRPRRPSSETRPSIAEPIAEKRTARHNRRHGLVEPVRRISSAENSDDQFDQFLSDDSFMEELKSATVQEAKPISVSKSPITPVFPRSIDEQRTETKVGRSVSTPPERSNTKDVDIPSETSALLSPRSISASKPRSASPSQTSPPMLGKLGVSSGISQRIKALEKLSSRPASPAAQLSSPPNGSSPFSTLDSRKPSFRSRPGTSDRPCSRQALLAPSPILSPTTSFEISHPKPYNQFISVNVASKPGKSRPESISVTARIVRDGRNQTPEVPRDASEPCVIDLHHSPLEVEHRSAEVVPLSSRKPPIKRHTTAPSVSSNKSETVSSSKRNSMASGSNGSRRGSDVGLPRSVSEISLSGLNGGDTKGEKKESRKSRLLKRMSNSMAASRRSIATALSPPAVREESIAEHHESPYEAPSATVDIGDVNIQFPDTLLWRRRQMSIDAQGIVVLSPSKADSNARVVTKRYPLTEFFPPYIPDQDRQEMPNSVNLDFKDGSTLQCACENLSGQARVLGALTQAHYLFNSK